MCRVSEIMLQIIKGACSKIFVKRIFFKLADTCMVTFFSNKCVIRGEKKNKTANVSHLQAMLEAMLMLLIDF